MFAKPPVVLLDACCAINLLATGACAEILSSLPSRFAVVDYVLEHEVLSGEEAEDRSEERPPNLGSSGPKPAGSSQSGLRELIDAGLLEVLSLSGEAELESFVDLAAELDDGEAMTGAIALHRDAAVATDDRKAIRVLTARSPDVVIHRTSALIRSWVEARAVERNRVRQVLLRIQTRASFVPGRDDQDRDWWAEVCRAGDAAEGETGGVQG